MWIKRRRKAFKFLERQEDVLFLSRLHCDRIRHREIVKNGVEKVRKQPKDKKFISLPRYLISLVAVAIIAVGGTSMYFEYKIQMEEAENGSSEGDLKKVDTLYNDIIQNYVGKVDKGKLVDGALKGMTEALDDPFTNYFSQEDASELNESLSGSFEGIGATMMIKEDLPTIAETPEKGTPAAKAGLEKGDVFLKINGKSTEGKTLDTVVKEIRGEKGTIVKITYKRGEDIHSVSVVRASITNKSITYSMDSEQKSIGKIQISNFSETSFKELKTAVQELRKQEAKKFIIDLRGNPGGYLDQVEKMSSMFLKDGKTIVEFEDKQGKITKEKASKTLDGGFKVTDPTVVLVDGNSASASEIFAAALNQSAGDDIVGTKTFGKGTVQTVNHFGDESEVKLTIMKWLTPNGSWIHEKGLEPTIKIDYPEYAYLKGITASEDLKVGGKSGEIKNLNRILKAVDFDVDDTDEFNEKTENAVKTIQEQDKLHVTGKVDEQTSFAIEKRLYDKIMKNDTAYKKAVEVLTKE